MGGGKVSVTILVIVLLVTSISISGCLEKTSTTDISKDPIDSKDNLTVHFLDVGQGDSILIQFSDKNILIDGGESDMGDRVAAYLKGHGVSKIDLMVATHPHSDHIGGLGTILKSFPIGQILDSGQVHSSQTYENFLTLIDKKDIPYTAAERDQTINLDPRLNIEVLNPPTKTFEDINDNSVILRITFGQISFLLMGDAENEAEESLLSSNYNLNSDILKVGHHGSTSSSSPAFIEAVNPEVSVIEVGAGNDYGHPHRETLSALRNAGSVIYRTDLDGNIDVTTDGESYYVTTQKAAPMVGTSSHNNTTAISISAVQFDAPGDDRQNLNGEWIQVTNSGQTPTDMTGWRLYDENGQVYMFPNFTLEADASVKVF